MSPSRNDVMLQLNSYYGLREAFIAFQSKLQEQLELIFTAGQVLVENMNDDEISQNYVPHLEKICFDLQSTIESAGRTIKLLSKKIDDLEAIRQSSKWEE